MSTTLIDTGRGLEARLKSKAIIEITVGTLSNHRVASYGVIRGVLERSCDEGIVSHKRKGEHAKWIYGVTQDVYDIILKKIEDVYRSPISSQQLTDREIRIRSHMQRVRRYKQEHELEEIFGDGHNQDGEFATIPFGKGKMSRKILLHVYDFLHFYELKRTQVNRDDAIEYLFNLCNHKVIASEESTRRYFERFKQTLTKLGIPYHPEKGNTKEIYEYRGLFVIDDPAKYKNRIEAILDGNPLPVQ